MALNLIDLNPLFYSSLWFCARAPLSLSAGGVGGWGNCYPFINRCCSRCLCLLSRSAPTTICCCWTRTICCSTWLLNRGGGYGNTERKKVTWGIGRQYGLGDAFILYENNDFVLWLQMLLTRNVRFTFDHELNGRWREWLDPSCLWRFSIAVCLSVAKVGAIL